MGRCRRQQLRTARLADRQAAEAADDALVEPRARPQRALLRGKVDVVEAKLHVVAPVRLRQGGGRGEGKGDGGKRGKGKGKGGKRGKGKGKEGKRGKGGLGSRELKGVCKSVCVNARGR